MGPYYKVGVPDGMTEIMEDLTRAILKESPENIYQFAHKYFEALLSLRKAHSSGLSASSTDESANRVIKDEILSNEERKLSNSNAEEKHFEEPQSNDTSYGVEATAVRTLAASTGTVAILGTTAQSTFKEEDEKIVITKEVSNNVDFGDQTFETDLVTCRVTVTPASNIKEDVKESSSPDQIEIEEKKEVSLDDKKNETDDTPMTKLDIDLPIITVGEQEIKETVSPVNSLKRTDSGIIDEILIAENPLAKAEYVEIGMLLPSPDNPGGEIFDDLDDLCMLIPSHDNIKVNEEEDYDISSEQLKTNSLSDASISETLQSETDETSHKKSEAEEQVKSIEESTIEAIEKPTDVETDKTDAEETVDPGKELSPDASEIVDLDAAAIKIQSGIRGFLVRKQLQDEGSPRRLSESIIDDLKQEVNEICDEAERATESIINSPISEAINPDEEFPAPPDDMLLEAKQEIDKQNLEPSKLSEALSALDDAIKQESIEVISDRLPEFDDNSVADSEPLPNDDDLPAPDFDLLESSNTDDIQTEINNESDNINTENDVEELRDSTEGDMTMDEDSDKIKDLQNPQEFGEVKFYGLAEIDAANKIQAGVRDFLSRKQAQGDSSGETDSDDLSGLNNSRTDLIDNSQNTDDSSSNNAADNDSSTNNAVNVWDTLEKEVAQAATTIQAGFRGYKVRKEAQEAEAAKKDLNKIEAAAETKPVEEDESPKSESIITTDSDLINKSAAKIQAGVRGYLVRKKKQVDSPTSN